MKERWWWKGMSLVEDNEREVVVEGNEPGGRQ